MYRCLHIVLGLFCSYPLIATGKPPKPQGPYPVKPGGTTTITFKNPFSTSKTVRLAVEPEEIFSLKSATEAEVEAKKEIRIGVAMQTAKDLEILLDNNCPVTGRLVVQCEGEYVKWAYYLKGDLN